MKLLGQCSLIRKGGNQSVRRDCDYKHQCSSGARADGMTNTCKLLINVVIRNKPKMLRGLNQKVRGSVRRLPISLTQTQQPPAKRQRLTRPGIRTERGKPASLPLVGTSLAKETDGEAGTGGWRKQKPRCNGVDTRCNIPRRESEQTSIWSFITRTRGKTAERRKSR